MNGTNRFTKISAAFALCSLLLCAMLAVRVLVSQTLTFVFLVWNIFLAWVPYVCSIFIVSLERRAYSPKIYVILFTGLSFFWFLTLPNSFYIITDIMHINYLGGTGGIPLWYDSLLVSVCGFIGLIMGFCSLYIIQNFSRRYLRPLWVWTLTITVIFLSSFGIYLGRFLRWNSWDVIRAPWGLFSDIGSRIINPLNHPRTFLFTISYSFCLVVLYLVLYSLINLKGSDDKL